MKAPLKLLIEKLSQLRDLSNDNIVKATYQIAITEAKDMEEYESDYVRKKISDSDKVWKEMNDRSRFC